MAGKMFSEVERQFKFQFSNASRLLVRNGACELATVACKFNHLDSWNKYRKFMLLKNDVKCQEEKCLFSSAAGAST